MGIFGSIKRFFAGDDSESRALTINENAITEDSFVPNDSNLYTSSQLVREANYRGWIVDNELVKQSSEIAKNAQKNAKNVKKFGKNIKQLVKAERLTAKEMEKVIQLTAANDVQKFGTMADIQAGLNAQTLAIEAVKSNYREQLKANNQRFAQSLNETQSRREKLRGR